MHICVVELQIFRMSLDTIPSFSSAMASGIVDPRVERDPGPARFPPKPPRSNLPPLDFLLPPDRSTDGDDFISSAPPLLFIVT